ncbi:MAG: long-chain fatty acid--CoA ligase, partial [Comamonadaceae bacterium]
MNPSAAAAMPDPTLVDLLAGNAARRGNRAAVIVDDRVHTHAMLHEAVRRQAAALVALGVRPGDRIVLLAGNRAEVLVLLGAAGWIGAMLVPLNLRLSAAELAQQAQDAAPALVVLDPACDTAWRAAFPQGMPEVPVAGLAAADGPSLAIAGPTGAAPAPRADAPELAVLMLYTAAVDGRARGAVLSQANLLASAGQIARAWSLDADDRWLGVLPLFHAAGIGLALTLL